MTSHDLKDYILESSESEANKSSVDGSSDKVEHALGENAVSFVLPFDSPMRDYLYANF